jgi:hypothetical protein
MTTADIRLNRTIPPHWPAHSTNCYPTRKSGRFSEQAIKLPWKYDRKFMAAMPAIILRQL